MSMIIGTVKEIKIGENRIALSPKGVKALVDAGHTVLVESKAGVNSSFSDDEYKKSGGKIVKSAKEIFRKSDMIVKVKEPQKTEYKFLREGQILFTFLHLAPERELTKILLKKKVTGIAYETIELPDGSLPLLTPMSEVAGRVAVQVGAHYLEKTQGGSGKLLSGATGVEPANVVILGSGVVGTNAAKIAFGLGAKVIVIGRNPSQLKNIENMYPGIITLESNSVNIEKSVEDADLLIGAVAITGARAPKLVTRKMVRKMKPGSVIVDVSIDQGGCIETSRLTTLKKPTYVEEGIIHYCVTNMPSLVSYTSTLALTNTTLPYVLKIANKGLVVLKSDNVLAKGVNTFDGKLTQEKVAEALKMKYSPLVI